MAFTRPKAAQIDFDVTNISDPLIRLNSGQSGSADKDVGIVVERGSDTNVALLYDESADEFVLVNTTEDGTTSGNVTISSYADLRVAGLTASSVTSSGAIAMGTNKITGLGDPTANQDAATKAYVDSQVSSVPTGDITAVNITAGTGLSGTVSTSSGDHTQTLAIDSTVATLTGSQTLTNKTLTSPVISTISNTGTITLPTSTDTLVGRATTDTLTNKTLTSAVLNTGVSGTAVLDEDDMSSNSATQLATQQSIKAYVDTQLTAEDLDITSDSGTIAIDLDSETLTIAGGTGIDSSATSNTVTLAIDSTVATLTGTQTLTNKTLTSPTITGTGAIAGTFTGDVTGNADTATALATARNIAGQSFDGTANITIASTDLSDTSNLVRNNQNNTITSTTAGSSAAPEFELFRDITGADSNYIGQIKFSADNDADQKTVFAKITGKIGDASDGTEDGIIEIAHIKAGSQNINVRMTSTEFKILNGTDFDIETHDGSSAGLRLNNTLVTSTAAELNILDGVTTTATELNIIDGDTSATSTTLADADRVVVNDAGTMKQVALTDFETYFETSLDTLSNVTSVGTLNGLAVASTQTVTMGANRVQNVADPVGNQDAATKAYVDANAGSGGGASGFTSSTFTTAPGSDGDFDLSFNVAQDTQENPFESGGTDAFGVALGEVYDMMEPVGSTSSVDLASLQ